MRCSENPRLSVRELPPAAGFESIEAMQQAASEAGWDIEYRQLEPGAIRARTELAEVGGILLSLEQATRRLEVEGEPPEALVVTLPCADSYLSINGQSVGDDRMFVTTPGAELFATSSPLVEVVTMHVPLSLFAAHAEALWPEWYRFTENKAQNIPSRFEPTERFRQQILTHLRTSVHESREPELAGELVTEFVSLIVALEQRSDDVVMSPSTRWWLLNRAREYIEDHLAEPITMAALCEYTGASLSTVEKIFRHELSMPPTVYIRNRRLNAARRLLVSDEHDAESISRIAVDSGFTHLGRFSVAYRELFGMSPRQERELAHARWIRSTVGVRQESASISRIWYTHEKTQPY